jgi:hypothetical protein
MAQQKRHMSDSLNIGYDELSGVLLINTKKEKEKMLNPYESYVSQYAKNHGISVVEAENRPMCKARLEYFNKTGK